MRLVDSVKKFAIILTFLIGLALSTLFLFDLFVAFLNNSVLSGVVAVAKITQTKDTQSQTSERAKH